MGVLICSELTMYWLKNFNRFEGVWYEFISKFHSVYTSLQELYPSNELVYIVAHEGERSTNYELIEFM